MGILGRARDERQPRDRGHRRERFATETHGTDRFEFVQAGNLIGGVARQGQAEFGLGYAPAIIADRNAAYAASVQANFNGPGSGIDGVFQQFFQDRGGALDNFAGGNLADQQVGQGGDRTAFRH